MSDNTIFIHIPKTGGTTINCAINNTEWQTEPDFNYRHINHKTKRSNSKDIFEEQNFEKYKDYQIFTMLRDPVDRLISEYYFIRDRSEFMEVIRERPRTFEAFVNSRQTQNYMVGFLVGKKMYDTSYPNEQDLQSVLHAIDNLPIYVGIFEYFSKSLAYFEDNLSIKWSKQMKAKRITLNRPDKATISDELRAHIYAKNNLDNQLYQHCLKKLKEQNIENYRSSVVFDKNKYDYVMKYTQRFSLFQLFLGKKKFLHTQKEYFHNLSWHLQHNLKFDDGQSYTLTYLHTFVNSLQSRIKTQENLSALNAILEQDSSPIEKTEAISNLLDAKILVSERGLLTKKMNFNPSHTKPVAFKSASSSASAPGLLNKFKGLFGN